MKYAQIYELQRDIKTGDPQYPMYYEKGELFVTIPVYAAQGAYMSLSDGSLLSFDEVYEIAAKLKCKLFEYRKLNKYET